MLLPYDGVSWEILLIFFSPKDKKGRVEIVKWLINGVREAIMGQIYHMFISKDTLLLGSKAWEQIML